MQEENDGGNQETENIPETSKIVHESPVKKIPEMYPKIQNYFGEDQNQLMKEKSNFSQMSPDSKSNAFLASG